MANKDNFDLISERIHDADSEDQEKMVHWLHYFLLGEISKEELEANFTSVYEKQTGINFPWEKDSL